MAEKSPPAEIASVGDRDQDLFNFPHVSNFDMSTNSPVDHHQAIVPPGEDALTQKVYNSPSLDLETDLSHSFSDVGQTSLAITNRNYRNQIVQFVTLAMQSMLQWSLRSVRSIVDSYDGSAPIPRDHVRIRWTCKCGKQLFDDFIEKRPGAARLLEQHLNRPKEAPGGAGTGSSSSSHPSIPGRSSLHSQSTPATSIATEEIPKFRRMKRGTRYTPALNGNGPPSTMNTSPLLEQLWVLACAERQKFTTKLVHFDADSQKIRSDMDLAHLLKRQYAELRPSWKQYLRLRGIQFVQFELHRSQVVDIRKCPDMPDKADMTYLYLPTDLIPPVGEHYLMHLFHHPEDYEDETITYNRIPKKRGAKLRVSQHDDVGV